MNDIKCPYCDKPLHCGATLKSDEYLVDLYQCSNPECESTEFLVGCREFWDILGQLIRTRKALEIAMGFIEKVRNNEDTHMFWIKVANDTINKIIALEQKDK